MNVRTLGAVGAIAALAGAYALSRRAGFHEDLDWDSVDKPGSIIDVDGYGVHCVEQGVGPPVVLVHGFGGSTYSYRKLMPLLARAHRVIAVDLKGYGYSERDPYAGLAHTDQVKMLHALLLKLGVERATFVGHSMGGAIVMRFAAAHPEMVDALVLAASVAGDERFARRVPPAALVRPFVSIVAALTSSRLLKDSFYDPSLLTDEVREAYLRPLRIRGTLEGILRSARESAHDQPIDYAAITMPALLLNAAQDPVVPLRTAQHVRELLPHSRLVVVDHASHLLLEERPDECATAITEFLSESRGQGAAAARGA